MNFVPVRVFFEKDALEFERGRKMHEFFISKGIAVKFLESHNRVTGIPGKTPQESYAEGKKTLVVGVRKTLDFSPCKPSAHYQLPLATSCAGKCEYCYLNTQLGSKPYLRVYVNIQEILDKAKKYIEERNELTLFEASATSDPIPVEPYTGALRDAIDFFGNQPLGKLRFVTKFTEVDDLLNLDHKGNTTVRFSVNTDRIIKKYEHQTPILDKRLEAAAKIYNSNYPLGFIIAPIFIYEGWQKDYEEMLFKIKSELGDQKKGNLSFEVISHRFTKRAKESILKVFPKSDLPMDEEERKFKFGYNRYCCAHVDNQDAT